MLLLRSNGTLLHMKDCIITFVKLIISKKHNFILYNALTNRDSPNFPLPSNPLPQIVTSNPRLQPDTHFAVDMFPYKTTELFQELGFYSQLPKKPGNTPLSGTWFYFLDINTTVSTWHDTFWLMSGILPVLGNISCQNGNRSTPSETAHSQLQTDAICGKNDIHITVLTTTVYGNKSV